MCGRYVFDTDADPVLVIMNYIEQRFGREWAAKIKTGEIFPANSVPVLLTAEADPISVKKPGSDIKQQGGALTAKERAKSISVDKAQKQSSKIKSDQETQLQIKKESEIGGSSQLIALPMIWGFPGFRGSQMLINARQETVEEKTIFRDSYKTRRCVIPTTGFFEWSHDDKGKSEDKFRFNVSKSPMVFLAGIYTWIDQEMRFVILTTAANSSMADIHDRQPVILPRQMIRPWISDLAAADKLRQAAGPQMIKTLIK